MSCETIKQQIQKLKADVEALGPIFRNVRSQVSGVDVYNVNGQALENAVARAKQIERDVTGLASSAQFDENKARDLRDQARAQNCGIDVINAANDVIGLAKTVFDNTSLLFPEIGKKVRDGTNRLEAEKSTTSENNAGTGAPGSAGTGPNATPDADQLEEVAVTAKRKPEPVTEPQPSDGLEEVEVTGKRNPDPLEEVQVTGTRSLEEVEVTGTRREEPNTNSGLQGQKENARVQATIQDTTNFEQFKDWRVRLALSPGANYLYKAPEAQRGILDPLSKTNGVVFPYTPSVTVSYMANYDHTTPTHSNYKILQYTNSAVDNVTLACDFTAQDTLEANYLLAVIHFFRSVTKMWYGQDQFPKPGTPPPLVYLFGLGEFQFNAHPLVVTNFTYSLPADVDYIRAGAVTANPGVNRGPSKQTEDNTTPSGNRLQQIVVQIGKNFLNNILPGGEPGPANFTPSGFNSVVPAGTAEPTYVPTKINLMITCMPVISRNEISNNFSLKDYGTGKLLRGVQRSGGGFW